MEYQLVLQFPILTRADFDKMIELEELIRVHLGNTADVDGHDAGSGEGNIFIFTNDPRDAFSRIRTIPGVDIVMPQMKAAYHEVEKEQYTILHPMGLDRFNII